MDREAELEKLLHERDAQVAQLAAQLEEMRVEVARMKTGMGGSLRRVSSAGTHAKAVPLRGVVPTQAANGRPTSPGGAGRRPSTAGADSRSRASPQRPTSASADFFHASQRGGTLTEPRQWKGLTPEERSNPYDAIRGPSLLTRERFGAKKPVRDLLATVGNGGSAVNLLLDENSANDPIKYPPAHPAPLLTIS
eukprot:scaffold1854_cov113-Isochrysis_galbana.AAC.3